MGRASQTATLVSPVNVNSTVQLRGSLGSTGLGAVLGTPAPATAVKEEVMRPGVLVGGVLIGVMIGGLALLFRRFWG